MHHILLKKGYQMKRINLGEGYPEFYNGVIGLEQQMVKLSQESGLEKGLVHLLKLRASQINHCAFCCRMHAKDALAHGVSADKINVLPAWQETEYFTEQERAALALVEAITLVSVDQVPDEVYTAAAKVLSEKQLAAVAWLAIVINIWNRIAITGHTHVGP